MRSKFKTKDRVRVSVRNRSTGYEPGDKGTVIRSSLSMTTNYRFYEVAMVKDNQTASGALFYEDEIELDL
jgi:hypothetical protein